MISQKKAKTSKNNQSSNLFAKALAETEKSSYGQRKKSKDQISRETSNKTDSSLNAQEQVVEQQNSLEELEKKQKRKKLHEQINPVDQFKIFDAREKQVKEEINKVRDELKLLALEVSKFNKEVEVTLMTEVVNPGQQGTYYINFFQQLRAFIILLRQKVRSARTWAKQMHTKKKKKKKAGLDFGGNEAKSVHDMLHHERYNAYSGG